MIMQKSKIAPFPSIQNIFEANFVNSTKHIQSLFPVLSG